MSMFNDIEWNSNNDDFVSNAEKVENYAMRFLQGHWTFLGSGSEEKMVWRLTLEKEYGILQPTKWYSDSKNLMKMYSKVPVHRVVGS